MNTRSFSKEFPVGYQWIYIILLIVFLCFASVYNSYAVALNTSKTIEAGITKDLAIDRDNGLDAKSGHISPMLKKMKEK
jgi:hypothetical protein